MLSCEIMPVYALNVYMCPVRRCVGVFLCKRLCYALSLALKPTERVTCQWNCWVCSIEELTNPMPRQIQYLHIQRSQTAAMFSLHKAARLTEAQMPLHRLCKTCSSSGLDSLIRFTLLFTQAL